MKFVIDPIIFEQFPMLQIGVIICKNLSNNGQNAAVAKLLEDIQIKIKNNLSLEELSHHPNIQVWQEVYRSFGAKPRDHRSSIENLCRLILSGVQLKQINKLVDLYNCISLKYMLPVGGEDLDKVQGDIHLTQALDSEPEVLLLGDREPRQPHKGEVIYKDDISAICRRWNWREADRTKLTAETKNSILVLEGLPPVSRHDIEEAAQELKNLIQKYCGGEITYAVMNSNNTEITLL